MHVALFVGVVVACATLAMAEVGEEPSPTTTPALTTSTVKTTPITQIHPTKATTTEIPMTTTTAAPIIAIAMADAPKLADTNKGLTTKMPMTTTTAAPIIAVAIADAPKLTDTIKVPTTTVAPKPAETTTTTATTDTPKRWSRNPRSNTTTTEVPTTIIATTTEAPTTKVWTKVPETTTTDKLTPTTIDKPRYRRSEPVITTTIKPKALLPTKPESNETTLWFAATKSDDEWKNATFARERKHGENGTDEWEGADENREEITIAIIEKYERTVIIHQEEPATNGTTAVIKKDEDVVDVDAPKAGEKEVDTDSDESDDDDLPKGASVII